MQPHRTFLALKGAMLSLLIFLSLSRATEITPHTTSRPLTGFVADLLGKQQKHCLRLEVQRDVLHAQSRKQQEQIAELQINLEITELRHGRSKLKRDSQKYHAKFTFKSQAGGRGHNVILHLFISLRCLTQHRSTA